MNEFLNDEEIRTFTGLINDYRMNESAGKEFISSNFACIAGPAGAGKDTIRNLLISTYPGGYAPVLSTTTRPPREGEKNGIDYHFRSKEEIRRSLESGEFFQAALVHNQQVSCLHISEIQKLAVEQIGLSILIVQTEAELHKIKPDIKTIFLIPPSLNELKRRMQSSRSLSKDEINRRILAAKAELEIALKNPRYYCIVNDNLDEALEYAKEFLESNGSDNEVDNLARQVIKNILDEIQL